MTDGRVFQIRENAISLKYFEELEHVLFLLQVKNRSIDGAAGCLKSNIQRQKKLYSVKSDNPYCPKYISHSGEIVEMKPNTAKIITTFSNIKGLEFNLESDKAYIIRLDQDIRKAKINDLRAAIFQTGEDTVELKNSKRRMVNELEYAERYLMNSGLAFDPSSNDEAEEFFDSPTPLSEGDENERDDPTPSSQSNEDVSDPANESDAPTPIS
ncbi:hypothetical protein AgCh_034429 [Apium graveolens]